MNAPHTLTFTISALAFSLAIFTTLDLPQNACAQNNSAPPGAFLNKGKGAPKAQPQSFGTGQSGWQQPSGSSGDSFNQQQSGSQTGQSEWTMPNGGGQQAFVDANQSQGGQTSQGTGQSEWMMPGGGGQQSASNNTMRGGTQQAPLFGEVLQQEQNQGGGGQQSQLQPMPQAQQRPMNNMAGMGAGMGNANGMGGMLGSMMSGGMGQNAMGNMMNFLQNVMPGAAATMQPNMGGMTSNMSHMGGGGMGSPMSNMGGGGLGGGGLGGGGLGGGGMSAPMTNTVNMNNNNGGGATPGFPAPGSLSADNGGMANSGGGGDAGFPAPGSVGTTGSASMAPAGTNGAFVPMGQSNFVPMGQQANRGKPLTVPRPIVRSVNRASRNMSSRVNSMLYRSMNNIRF